MVPALDDDFGRLKVDEHLLASNMTAWTEHEAPEDLDTGLGEPLVSAGSESGTVPRARIGEFQPHCM